MINKAMEFARGVFEGDASGHDFDHTLRVFHTATRLAQEEGADMETVQLAALLHDVDDRKLSPETYEGKLRAVNFLKENNIEEDKIREIICIISHISFSAQLPPPESIEGKCVQDADRLDALGAIGIARTFAFGGAKNRPLEESLAHFDEKLLLLYDLLSTDAAKTLAKPRWEFLKQFYRQYKQEQEI